MTHRALVSSLLSGFIVLGAAPLTGQADTNEEATHPMGLTSVAAADLAWGPIEVPGFDSGMELAVISGDPGAAMAYIIRLRFPDGYRFPPHFHPMDENLTVLSGTFLLAMGEEADESSLEAYSPGDYLFAPAMEPHHGGARGETVIQLHGTGPFDIIVVGSPEDTR